MDTFVSPEGGSSTAFVSPFDAGFTQNAIPDRSPETIRVPNTHARCGEMPAPKKETLRYFLFSRLFQFCVLSWKDVFFIMVSNQVQTLGKTPFRPTNFRRQNSNFQTMRHLSYNKKSCRMAIGLVELISTSLSEI